MKPLWVWRVLRPIAIGLVSLAVLFTVTVAVYRWRGPTQVQRDALAAMQERTQPQNGVNAFPLLWYMQYDVPDIELNARMASEVADAKARMARESEPFSPEPAARKQMEASGDASHLCDGVSAGCLDKVATDPRTIRDVLATFPKMRAREAAFYNTAFFWSDFPADYRVVLPFPNPGAAQRIWLSAAALQYVEGDQSGALANVCRNIGTWRRLRHGTNSLVGSSMATRQADAGMYLFGEMLAALPAGETVPGECGEALRPIEVADADRCGELPNEFGFVTSSTRNTAAQAKKASAWDRALGWLFFDAEQTDAWRAEQFATFCGENATQRILADMPLSADAMPIVTHRMECFASLAGCILADIGGPAYVPYDNRALDFLAHLRLAATLLSIRESGSDQSTAVLFEKHADLQRSRRRHSDFDRETGVLFVDNLDTVRSKRFELPVARRSR